MKNKVIKALVTVLTSMVLVSCTSIKTTDRAKTGTTEQAQRTVTSQQDNRQVQLDNVEVYHTQTIKELEAVTEVLENRQGKIIIEIVNGVVLDDDGNGKGIFTEENEQSQGYYIKYDSGKFGTGDIVQSVFIYNPDNNLTDDIVYRYDILMN